MNTSRTRAATTAAAVVALLTPAAALASNDVPEINPAEVAALAVASQTSTYDRVDITSPFQWVITSQGPVSIGPEAIGATSTPTGLPRSEGIVGTVIGSLTEPSPDTCLLTMSGSMQSTRPFGGSTTDHSMEASWHIQCHEDVDWVSAETVNFVWAAPVVGVGAVDRLSVRSLTLLSDGHGPIPSNGVLLPVDVVNPETGIHGTGSNRIMEAAVDLQIDGLWSGTVCVSSFGREGTGIQARPYCGDDA